MGDWIGGGLFLAVMLGVAIYASFKSQPAQWWLRRRARRP